MKVAIRRKDFLRLTVTLSALGVSTACGDDPADDDETAGNGGDGTAAGKPSGGTAGSTTAGQSAGGKVGGEEGGAGAGGDANAGGGPGTDIGGAGGDPVSAGAGAGAVGGEGGSFQGGAGGAAGTAGAAGAAGESNGPQECGSATIAQTAGTHEHIPNDASVLFTSFRVLVNGSNPTVPFALPQNGTGHSHNIKLTEGEVATLRAGGTVTGKVSTETNAHSHAYSISCA